MTMAPAEFAHPVEQAVADVLDELGIRWLYEPHTFTLEYGDDGKATAAFTPDFYLPEIGVYIECTVAKRKYLNGKRQKGRAAREQHGTSVRSRTATTSSAWRAAGRFPTSRRYSRPPRPTA